jgi:hypothetical protein
MSACRQVTGSMLHAYEMQLSAESQSTPAVMTLQVGRVEPNGPQWPAQLVKPTSVVGNTPPPVNVITSPVQKFWSAGAVSSQRLQPHSVGVATMSVHAIEAASK